MSTNIFGEKLLTCSTTPMTGFYRNGCCESAEDDLGMHTICAVMSEEFLLFSQSRGNDLITPRPEFGFPGLKKGDHWCLCVTRWIEAYRAGKAPRIILEATNESVLGYVSMEELIKYSHR